MCDLQVASTWLVGNLPTRENTTTNHPVGIPEDMGRVGRRKVQHNACTLASSRQPKTMRTRSLVNTRFINYTPWGCLSAASTHTRQLVQILSQIEDTFEWLEITIQRLSEQLVWSEGFKRVKLYLGYIYRQAREYGGSKRPSPLLCRIIVLSHCRPRQCDNTTDVHCRIVATVVLSYCRIVRGDNAITP